MAALLRFDRSARHGAALVGIVFAAYLTIATDFSAIIQAADYAGSIPSDVPLVDEVQFATILTLEAVSLAALATTAMRRAIALTAVPLVLLGWAFLSTERGDGVLPLGDSGVWAVLLSQGFITLLVGLGGWLIVSGRHPLAWTVLPLALIPALVALPLDASAVDATAFTLIIQGVVIVAGVMAVTGALAIDGAMRRRAGAPRPSRATDALRTGTRYGVALGLVLAAGSLSITTDFTGFLQQTKFAGSASVSVLGVLQFLLILALYVAAMIVMPVSADRRLAAVTIVSVLLLLWATFGIERSVGNIREPVAFWFFVLDQGFVTLLVSLGGWLIVRGRPPLAFIVLLLAIIPPVIARALDDASVTSGAYALVMEGIVVLAGLAGGGIAWAIDAIVRRRRGEAVEPVGHPEAPEHRAAVASMRPRAVTVVAVIVWVGGAIQILTGALSFAGQGVSGEEQRASALIAALVNVLVGVATVIVGVGLLRGNRAARLVVTIVVAVSLLGNLLALAGAAAAGESASAIVLAVTAAIDAAGIVLLWAGSGRSYFGRQREAEALI